MHKNDGSGSHILSSHGNQTEAIEESLFHQIIEEDEREENKKTFLSSLKDFDHESNDMKASGLSSNYNYS